MAVKGFHFLCPVEQVVGVAGPVVRLQVPGFVIGKCCGFPSFRVLGQVVRRGVAVLLLLFVRYPEAAVPCLVVIEPLRVGRILYLGQLVHAVVGIAGGAAGLLPLRAVAVMIVAVAVVRQHFPAQQGL